MSVITTGIHYKNFWKGLLWNLGEDTFNNILKGTEEIVMHLVTRTHTKIDAFTIN